MTDRRDRIAAAALSHAGCSDVLHPDVYEDIVVRPVDRTAALRGYYYGNAKLSTCALTVVGAWRLAGCEEPECIESYLPAGKPMRNAMADIQRLARRFDGAWVSSSPPVPPLQKGDAFVIGDATGMDGHVGIVVEDAIVTPGVWIAKTVEGGQSDGKGSSAIGAFTRTWHFTGGRWMLGARYLLGYASAGSLPVPDDLAPDPGDPPTAAKSAA